MNKLKTLHSVSRIRGRGFREGVNWLGQTPYTFEGEGFRNLRYVTKGK